MRDLLRRLGEEHTVIFSTHILPEVEAVCDRVLFIHEGKLAADGTVQDLEHLAHRGPAALLVLRADARGGAPRVRGRRGAEVATARGASTSAVRVPVTASGRWDRPSSKGSPRPAASAGLPLLELRIHVPSLEQVFADSPARACGRRRARRVGRRGPTTTPRPPSPSRRRTEMLSVYRKEMRSYLTSPIPYVLVIIFTVFMAWWFFFLDDFFLYRQARMESFFGVLPWVFIFLVPAISMRLWSEESRGGTLETLLTLPVRSWQIVLGKFLAAWTLLLFCLVATLAIPITVANLGDLDWGPVVGGYLGALLLGGALLALGVWVSALTAHQIVAFLVAGDRSRSSLVIIGARRRAGSAAAWGRCSSSCRRLRATTRSAAAWSTCATSSTSSASRASSST